MTRAVLPEIPKKAKVVKGDIVVAKDLTFHGATYVDGNVIVGGVLQEHSHKDGLFATGSIKAKGIKSGGTIYAGKTIEAEVIYVEMEGKVGAVGGVKADLFILEDADDAKCEGPIKAQDKITLSLASSGPLKKLKKLLAPHAFGLINDEAEVDDDSLFDYSHLMGAIARGKPWRANGGSGPRAKSSPTKPAPSGGGAQSFELADGGSSKTKKGYKAKTPAAGAPKKATSERSPKKPAAKAAAAPAKKKVAAAKPAKKGKGRKAQAEHDKLVKEKTKKGYVEK